MLEWEVGVIESGSGGIVNLPHGRQSMRGAFPDIDPPSSLFS